MRSILLALCLALSLSFSWDPSDEIVTIDFQPGVAPPCFAKAHRYHGVLHSFQKEEGGEFYFEREGQVCKLFRPGVTGYEEYLEWKERRGNGQENHSSKARP